MTTHLTYWQSAFLSILNHEWHNITSVRKSKRYLIRQDGFITNNHSRGVSFELDHKFIEKYINEITDRDVINIIIDDATVPEHLKIYLIMKNGSNENN